MKIILTIGDVDIWVIMIKNSNCLYWSTVAVIIVIKLRKICNLENKIVKIKTWHSNVIINSSY